MNNVPESQTRVFKQSSGGQSLIGDPAVRSFAIMANSSLAYVAISALTMSSSISWRMNFEYLEVPS